MNRWLYHAAGTAGIVGGVLLLGAGGAQAEDRNEDVNALLGDVLSPTRGLPPLNLPAELLPIGGSPLDALGGSPLDTAGLSDIALPLDLPLPTELVGLDGDPLGLPTRFADTGFRTLPAPAPLPATDQPDYGYQPHHGYQPDYGYRTLPAPAPDTGYRTLPALADQAGEEAGPAEIVGPMSYLTEPLTRSLLGGRSLGDLAAIGNPTQQIPVAGPIVSQTTRSLPLVSELMPDPQNRTMSVQPQSLPMADADPLAGPIGGDQLQPMIAQQLAAEGGYSPELLDGADPEQLGGLPLLGGGGLPGLGGGGGLPLIGPALDPVTQMVGIGDLPGQVPVVGPLTKPVLSGLPLVGDPAPAPAGPAVPGSQISPTELPGGPVPHPDTAADERPVAGDDPEYTESLI